jgi:hypothetical protein
MSGLQQSLPMFLILISLQILDVITTNLTPSLESNPVVLFLFAHLGEMWWLPKFAICLMISLGAIAAGRIPRRPLAIVTAGYAMVVLLNMANVVAIYLA